MKKLNFLFIACFGLIAMSSCQKEELTPDQIDTSKNINSLTQVMFTTFDGVMETTPATDEDWAWEMRGDYLGTFKQGNAAEEENYEMYISHRNETEIALVGYDIETIIANLVYYPANNIYSTFDGTNDDPPYIINFDRNTNTLTVGIKEPFTYYQGTLQN